MRLLAMIGKMVIGAVSVCYVVLLIILFLAITADVLLPIHKRGVK